MSPEDRQYWQRKGIPVLNSLPDGWRYVKDRHGNLMTVGYGHCWATNGKSRFEPDSEYERAIVPIPHFDGL